MYANVGSGCNGATLRAMTSLTRNTPVCTVHTNDEQGPLREMHDAGSRHGAAPEERLRDRPCEGDSAASGHLRGSPLHYAIAIESGTESSAWGVVVPDLPGCFSAGDTLDEAILMAEEAITAWIEATIDAGNKIPAPSGIEALRAAHPEFADWLWALVKVDPAMLDQTMERVNISLPRRVLRRLDARATQAGETRSGFIARMAIDGGIPRRLG